MSSTFRKYPIEKKILPLVNALNATKLVRTFSSCEGHYKGTDQKLTDRNFADVRFDKLPNTKNEVVDELLRYVFGVFYHLDTQMCVDTYKKYVPTSILAKGQDCYVIIIEPFDRFAHPDQKRRDTDEAIKILTVIVQEWTKIRRNKGTKNKYIQIPSSLLHYFPDKKARQLCDCENCKDARSNRSQKKPPKKTPAKRKS